MTTPLNFKTSAFYGALLNLNANKMKKFYAVYKIHLIAWSKLMGTLCGLLFIGWAIVFLISILFGTSVDTAKFIRLGVWFIFLGFIMPAITTKFFPKTFDS